MYARLVLALLLLWSVAAPAAAWKPLLPLKGQAVHVPFLAEYLKDPSVYRISSKKEFDNRQDELEDAKERLMRSKRRLQEYFFMLSESCYYLYYQRKTASLSREEETCHRELAKTGLKLLKSSKTQRKKIIYNVALSLFNLRKYREAHKQFSQLLSKSFSNPLALKAGLATYLIDLEIKKSIPAVSWKRLMAKFDVRGKIIIHLATARHLAGLNLHGEREKRASPRYRHYLQQLSPLLSDVSSETQALVLAFIIGVVRKAETAIDWQRFPVRIETFAYTGAFPALLERQALSALAQKRFGAALGLYKRLLPMVKGRKTQHIVRRLLVIAKKSYLQSRDSKEYRKVMHLSSNYLKSEADKKLLDKYIQFLINKESALIKNMQEQQLREVLLLIKDMLGLQTNTVYTVANKEILANIHLQLNNPSDAVNIYYGLFKELGGKTQKYIDNAIKHQHHLAKWPQTLVWQTQPQQLRAERLRLLKMYEQKTPLMAKPDWHIIAQRGLLSLNLNMKDKAWGLWINNMQHVNKKIAPLAIGMVLDDYLQSKLYIKAETLIKRCLRFSIKPQIKNNNTPLRKIYVDVIDKSIKFYLKTNKLVQARSKSIEFFKLFPKDNRQPENLLRLAEVLIKRREYVKAMFYLVELVNNYQNNNYFRQGLLLAASLAAKQADEQKAVVLYRLFYQRYPKDKAIKNVVLQLIKLYNSLRLYGDLLIMYEHAFVSPAFSNLEKQKNEIAMMELEEKYGSISKAFSIAKRVMTQLRRDARHKAIAASLLARYHYARKDNKALSRLESSLSASRYEYKEVRNELSFYIAETQRFVNQQITEKYEQKPVEFLRYLSSSFAQVKKNYLDVCKLATSRFCLASYLSLVDRCITFIDAASTAELSAASTRQAYDVFTKDKKSLINYFESQKKSFRNASVRELQSGNAPFEWVAKSLVVSPELNLSYVNGYLSEPDFIQLNVKRDLKGVK